MPKQITYHAVYRPTTDGSPSTLVDFIEYDGPNAGQIVITMPVEAALALAAQINAGPQ